MMPNLNSVVDYARTTQLVLIRWEPSADFFSNPVPVFAVKAAGNVLAWFPADSSRATGEAVRRIVPQNRGLLRLDFDTQEPMSGLLRPATKEEAARAQQWYSTHQALNIEASVDQRLQELQQRGPLPKRDKLYPVAFWGAYDHRLDREVPAGIVIPTDETKSLEWVALPGWEGYADSRNSSISAGLEDPLATLVDLAERPGQNHSISYPEYVRAANRNDAIQICMNRQRSALSKMRGAPE